MSFLKSLFGYATKLPALLVALQGLLIGIHEVEEGVGSAAKAQGAMDIGKAVFDEAKSLNKGGGILGKTAWEDIEAPLARLRDTYVATMNLVGKFTGGSGIPQGTAITAGGTPAGVSSVATGNPAALDKG